VKIWDCALPRHDVSTSDEALAVATANVEAPSASQKRTETLHLAKHMTLTTTALIQLIWR
jgi:hypothetical protein